MIDEHKQNLLWILELISDSVDLKKALRSSLQKQLKKNSVNLHKAFKCVSKLESLRWKLICFLRQSNERDFSVCKKITSRIKTLKATIASIEKEQRFKKNLLKNLNC